VVSAPVRVTESSHSAGLVPSSVAGKSCFSAHESAVAYELPVHCWVVTDFSRTVDQNVTDGIESALTRAREAAGDGDVSIHGGGTTINQCLAAGLIDELRLHIVPLTLGVGTRLFDGVPRLKLEQVKTRAATSVTHVTYRVLS
jgi:dihydrofolate reductase